MGTGFDRTDDEQHPPRDDAKGGHPVRMSARTVCDKTVRRSALSREHAAAHVGLEAAKEADAGLRAEHGRPAFQEASDGRERELGDKDEDEQEHLRGASRVIGKRTASDAR
jgi:hypothetical protein